MLPDCKCVQSSGQLLASVSYPIVSQGSLPRGKLQHGGHYCCFENEQDTLPIKAASWLPSISGDASVGHCSQLLSLTVSITLLFCLDLGSRAQGTALRNNSINLEVVMCETACAVPILRYYTNEIGNRFKALFCFLFHGSKSRHQLVRHHFQEARHVLKLTVAFYDPLLVIQPDIP